MNACILAIGTELTSGQIQNAHATWLASKLDDYGISVDLHMAVPDQEDKILKALEFVDKQTDIIFVTGGLGPTSDDITRYAMAKHLNKKIIFDQNDWSRVESILKSRKVKISEQHKRQSEFPAGSVVLNNPVGTAAGFCISDKQKKYWVLPGPSAELQGIWFESVQKEFVQFQRKLMLKKWRFLGLPESELADDVEEFWKNSGVTTGFRLSSPYVEVKVWMPSENGHLAEKYNKLISLFEENFKKHLFVRDNEDLALEFLNKCMPYAGLTIIDDVTSGFLARRIWEVLEKKERFHGFSFREMSSREAELGDMDFNGTGVVLKLLNVNKERSCKFIIKNESGGVSENLDVPMDFRFHPKRLGSVISEFSFKRSIEVLSSITSIN